MKNLTCFKIIGIIFYLISFISCVESAITEKDKLKETDRVFSNFCLENGMKKAFYEFADENAVMLRDNSYPIVGKERIKELLANKNDTLFSFWWEPIGADVAKSGELGYTFGTYKLQVKDSLFEGTYVSIWKKDQHGAWKYVLDSGNDGLGKD